MDLIARARKLEHEGRLPDALTLYTEGIDALITQRHKATSAEKQAINKKLKSYLEHAESLKQRIEKLKTKKEVRINVKINENSTGHAYSTIFGSYLKNCLRVELSDPYLERPHQIRNLHSLAETLFQNSVSNFIIETSKSSAESTELIIRIRQSFREILKNPCTDVIYVA